MGGGGLALTPAVAVVQFCRFESFAERKSQQKINQASELHSLDVMTKGYAKIIY